MSFGHYAERGQYPPLSASGVGVPIARLGAAARDLGHVNMVADPDGTTRWEALVIEYRGYYYPSLAVQAARLAMGVPDGGVKLDFGHALAMGAVAVPVDPRIAHADRLRGARGHLPLPLGRRRPRRAGCGPTRSGTGSSSSGPPPPPSTTCA